MAPTQIPQKFYALSVYPKIFSELYSLPKKDDESVDLHRLTNITKLTCAKVRMALGIISTSLMQILK